MNSEEKKEGESADVYVGTVAATPDGDYRLLTSFGHFRLAPAPGLSAWLQREVVVHGVNRGGKVIELISVSEMMTARDVNQFAHFLIARYGKGAPEHAGSRLRRALGLGKPQAIAIWEAICRQLAILAP